MVGTHKNFKGVIWGFVKLLNLIPGMSRFWFLFKNEWKRAFNFTLKIQSRIGEAHSIFLPLHSHLVAHIQGGKKTHQRPAVLLLSRQDKVKLLLQNYPYLFISVSLNKNLEMKITRAETSGLQAATLTSEVCSKCRFGELRHSHY